MMRLQTLHYLHSRCASQGIKITNNILICFSNTGGGHKSAAEAIRSAINELTGKENLRYQKTKVTVVDIVEKSSIIHWFYVALYNYLLRHHQTWMKYYYRIIELLRPDNSEIGYRLAFKFASKLLIAVDPCVVVSVHPMANEYLARILKEIDLPRRPKFVIVVTDPNSKLWRGWGCRGADLIVVPNELARTSLVSMGVDENKILSIGMPVNPEFLRPPTVDKSTFLFKLGLDPKKMTICLSAGQAGGGNTKLIYEALLGVSRPMQVIVVCGNNAELTAQIQELSVGAQFDTVIVEDLPSMSSAMSACDLLITKAGGLTTFEAVARRLPMAIDMITEPMPQELGTAQMLVEVGLAQSIKKPLDIVEIVNRLKPSQRLEKPLPFKYNLNRVDSVYEIAKVILANCEVQSTSNLLIVTAPHD